MIQTLIPAPVKTQARGRWFGYALTSRALLLLLAGCAFAVPGFFHPRSPSLWPWAMAAWDADPGGFVKIVVALEATNA